eukprot:gene8093-8286_t
MSLLPPQVFAERQLSKDAPIGTGVISLHHARFMGRHDIAVPISHKGRPAGTLQVSLEVQGAAGASFGQATASAGPAGPAAAHRTQGASAQFSFDMSRLQAIIDKVYPGQNQQQQQQAAQHVFVQDGGCSTGLEDCSNACLRQPQSQGVFGRAFAAAEAAMSPLDQVSSDSTPRPSGLAGSRDALTASQGPEGATGAAVQDSWQSQLPQQQQQQIAPWWCSSPGSAGSAVGSIDVVHEQRLTAVAELLGHAPRAASDAAAWALAAPAAAPAADSGEAVLAQTKERNNQLQQVQQQLATSLQELQQLKGQMTSSKQMP